MTTTSNNVDDDSESDSNDANDKDGGDGNNHDGEVEHDGSDNNDNDDDDDDVNVNVDVVQDNVYDDDEMATSMIGRRLCKVVAIHDRNGLVCSLCVHEKIGSLRRKRYSSIRD